MHGTSEPLSTDVNVEEGDAIQRALDRISPLLREALLLHELKGLTVREIADALEISEAATAQRITRAATEFRRHYTLPPEDG